MEAAPTFDLQSHSVHSDGELPPREVVRHAVAAGVELLALTDHDTVAGVDEALAAGSDDGVRVIPAVEVSAVHEQYEDLHILGYAIDHRHAAFRDRLAAYRADREGRADRMSARLTELGFRVDATALESVRSRGGPVGRPHLASSVLAHPANAERLASEGIADVSGFIAAYLVPGRPGYSGRTHPSVAQAIEAIHEAGGLAVWAHAFWDVSSTAEVLSLLDRFRRQGLDGAEAFYVTHSRDQTLALADRCAELGLLTTGSADFHGPSHRLFNRFRAFSLEGRTPRLGPLSAFAATP